MWFQVGEGPGSSHWHRPWHDQLVRVDYGGKGREGPRELGRRTNHAVGRGIHVRRRAPDGHAGQTTGSHKLNKHALCYEASHWTTLRRSRSPEGHVSAS